MAGISKAERKRRAAEGSEQKGPIPDDGDAGDAQPQGGEQGSDTAATDPTTSGDAEPDAPELVSMVRDDGRMPAKAHVHPDEVENYQRGGWRVA